MQLLEKLKNLSKFVVKSKEQDVGQHSGMCNKNYYGLTTSHFLCVLVRNPDYSSCSHMHPYDKGLANCKPFPSLLPLTLSIIMFCLPAFVGS